ncbi:E3 ubiquitin-protein ligase Midline-1-like isoform X2 [Ostrea edulis]|uniref:E3 ubiquitin-protein ligase Midline-1-like isoform X2 n=1 Tax=Ostrea edulis TaxID=37623 RepID=UPI0024AF0B00|nr:E3 ubiquitin-protein ligase Midline-1-like isoform X2 [Ostrea edulis]
MAASGVKDSINEIENICECSICCNTYDEDNHVPRILPCTHTFCTDCLSKHCSRQKIACPLCNKVHKISNKNILIFPKDNTRRELKSVLEKLSKVLCGVCGQHDKNSYFCLSCDIRICPRCYGERKVTTCRNHRLDRKNDSQSASNELSKKDLSRIVCLLNGHERNEMKFYCTERNCCKTVCANCIVEFHSEHIHLVKPVKHEYEARKNHLRDKCNRTKKKIDAAKHTLTELDRETLAMTSNFDRGKVKLDMATRKGIQYMEQYKELENMRWSKKLRDNLSNLTKCRECLQNFIDNATECCTISERSMASKNISEFLSTEKKLSQNFDCFTEMTVDQDIKKLTPSQAFQMRETIKEIEIKSKGLTVPLGAFLRLQAHIFDDEQSIRPFYKGVGIAVIVALLAFLLVQSVAYPHSMDEHRDGKNVYYVLLKMFSSVLYIKPFVR